MSLVLDGEVGTSSFFVTKSSWICGVYVGLSDRVDW